MEKSTLTEKTGDHSAQIMGQFRKNENSLHTLREIIPDGVIFIDKTGEIAFINPALEKITGLEYGQIVGNDCHDLQWNWADTNQPTVSESCNSIFDHIIKTGNSFAGKECVWKINDTKIIHFSIHTSTYPDENGDIAGAIVLLKNISEHKKTEIKKKEIKETYQRLANYADEALIRMRFNDGIITYINEAAQKILGYSMDDYFASPNFFKKIVLPEYLGTWQIIKQDLLCGKDYIKNMVLGVKAKDSRAVIMEFTTLALRDQNGKITHLESLGRDITAHHYMEIELAKAQKLESIGLLAGGIAHDFNNILTAILGSLALAKIEAVSPQKLFQRLANAEENCMIAKSLTTRLLNYSRSGSQQRTTAALYHVLKEATDFALSGKNAKYEFHIPEDIWPVQIDEGQIHNLANCLVTNAAEAMPNGGMIEIGAQNITLDKDQLPSLAAGNYVKWYVKDHGVGISPENIKKLFDPYFTTKQMSNVKGQGLELAICYSIVKNHEGMINVDSVYGTGTTFTIYLPAVDEESDIKKPVMPQEIKTDRKHKILLIDDEKILLDVTSNMIAHLGYEVTCAQSHKEAMDIYGRAKEEGNPFSLIIIDLTMRGDEGGEKAIRRWLAVHPEVKAVISSGYIHDPVIAEYWKYGFTGAMMKPYTLNDLKESLIKFIGQEKS